MVAYNRNIPQPTDLLSSSQGQLLANFQTIDSGTTGTGVGFARNHITMTDGTNGGLHNRVDFYQALSSPTVSGFVSSAYPFSITDTGSSAQNELYYKNASKDLRITDSNLTTASGEGMMPGGLQIRTGTVNGFVADNANHTIGYSIRFPTATIVVMTTASNSDYTHPVQTSGTGATGFSAKSAEGGTLNFHYVAIGY